MEIGENMTISKFLISVFVALGITLFAANKLQAAEVSDQYWVAKCTVFGVSMEFDHFKLLGKVPDYILIRTKAGTEIYLPEKYCIYGLSGGLGGLK